MTPAPTPSPVSLPAAAELRTLVASLDAVLTRESREAEVLAEIDAKPLASGRGQGVEFALDQYRHDLDALRTVRRLVARLAEEPEAAAALRAALRAAPVVLDAAA